MSDEQFMKRALALAKKGLGSVNPNPPVGAVIVRDGKVLSEGYHERFGGPHAERNAILNAKASGVDLRGATMYVTLEPCDHYGKTPPCTDLIIESGIRKVVIACRDPNPISGSGAEKLKHVGLNVEIGLLENEAKELMRFFLKHVTTGLPYVTLKYASTLDGKIADKNGNSKWITNELRKVVHRLRSEHMAVMVGAGTVLKDDPLLNIRLVRSKRKAPIKVILDRDGLTLRKRKDLRVFARDSKVIVFCEQLPRALEPDETHIELVPVTQPLDVLKTLGSKGIDSVLVEGGSEVFSQFLPFADEIYGFYGLKIFGQGTSIFPGVLSTVDVEPAFSIVATKVARNRSEFLVVMRRCSPV